MDPRARVLAPRFPRRHRVDAHPGPWFFSTVGMAPTCSPLLLIGVDAGVSTVDHAEPRVDVWRDLNGNGIVKSMVFGVICSFVALYQGYEGASASRSACRRR